MKFLATATLMAEGRFESLGGSVPGKPICDPTLDPGVLARRPACSRRCSGDFTRLASSKAAAVALSNFPDIRTQHPQRGQEGKLRPEALRRPSKSSAENNLLTSYASPASPWPPPCSPAAEGRRPMARCGLWTLLKAKARAATCAFLDSCVRKRAALRTRSKASSYKRSNTQTFLAACLRISGVKPTLSNMLSAMSAIPASLKYFFASSSLSCISWRASSACVFRSLREKILFSKSLTCRSNSLTCSMEGPPSWLFCLFKHLRVSAMLSSRPSTATSML
mmetsp:Transcript_71788/g.181124  ORF Transcript_71788/g.181124 Transcript_71788/m.181124 type:complete len:279 (+) Transcript_71788:389-1225(+)